MSITSWGSRGNSDYWIIAFGTCKFPSPARGTLVGAVVPVPLLSERSSSWGAKGQPPSPRAANVTFSNLTTPDTAAHIHCCGPLGTNQIVATTMPTFGASPPYPAGGGPPEFPLGVTSGTS